MRMIVVSCLLVAGLLVRGSDARADDPKPKKADDKPRYEVREDHDPNGIGKFYMGREIAHVMGFQAAGWLERTEREKEEEQRYKEILEDGLKRLSESGHAVRGQVLVGDAVDEIARHARDIGADLIVVGHKHLDSWAARWWRGSLSKSLIEHSPCSVLVVITR